MAESVKAMKFMDNAIETNESMIDHVKPHESMIKAVEPHKSIKCERCVEKKITTCVFCLDTKSYAYILAHEDIEAAPNLENHRGCSKCWQKWLAHGHSDCPVCKQTIMVKMYNDLVCSRCEEHILKDPGFAPARKVVAANPKSVFQHRSTYMMTQWGCILLIFLLISVSCLYAKTQQKQVQVLEHYSPLDIS